MNIIKKIFFIDLIKGLSLTFKYNVSKTITIRYPDEEKWIPYQRFRGLHTLNRDEKGRELCVACELCAKACPTKCITVVPMEDMGTDLKSVPTGIADRVAKVYEINLVRCMFCGLCEDACPTTAIRMGREYELACFSLDCARADKTRLLAPKEIPVAFEGGYVVKARLERTTEGIKVKPDLTKKKRWW
ncbi:MAG: NADH-quinone oxidoreductase subunit I [Deltaproteobacteria bacterium]|nr:NADH-quinone oxidoreductase subunit I [Deltaproteobacteria bacterium]